MTANRPLPTRPPPLEAAERRILVVEDDADARANLVDILELDGFAVDCAGTAAEALGKPDLRRYTAIVLDRRLPDATAELLLPDIRKAAPDAATVIVTGFADMTGVVGAMREGAVDYLFKPINVELLRAAIGRIVERRRLHEAMQRSESARRALMEAVPIIVVTLSSNGVIAYFNAFAAQVTGYSEADAVGKRFVDVFHPVALNRQQGPDQPYDPMRAGPARDVELAIHCRGESVRSTIWNWESLDDVDGRPIRIGVGQDITARKAAEQHALQNERLAAIGQTMAGLVHESRNALQRSKACLEMLAHEIRDNFQALGLLERVQRAQEDLHRLFEEVREYAAPLKLDRRPCDVAQIWREVWDQLADRWGSAEIALREPARASGQAGTADLVRNVDRFALAQVFRNVFENAIEASPPRGQITVEAAGSTLDGDCGLCVVVRDQGPGFSDEQRRRIFEPFFTTKTKGTGLGLAICQRIVHAHGGSIDVANNDGPGAAVTIQLP